MHADRIRKQIQLLETEQRRLRQVGHEKIEAFAKGDPDDSLTDQAAEHFQRANAMSFKIDALNQTLESAEEHDREEQTAALRAATAANVQRVGELADARVQFAHAVDKKFAELSAALTALTEASNEIASLVRAIIATRTQGLDPLRRAELLAVVMAHASADNPAFNEAIGQGVYRALPLLSGLVEFKSPVGDPSRTTSLARAADIAAFSLRHRLTH